MEQNIIHLGDCLEILRTIPDESVDAVVTDPPAGISFMGKDWDKDKGGRDEWISWLQGIMVECERVLKPGGHAIIWALPRTSHWTATAVENAGFQIRDVIHHIYASGFPKSANIGKLYDKLQGNEREVVEIRNWNDPMRKPYTNKHYGGERVRDEIPMKETKGNSAWEGFGTALKPACEHWILARKKLSEKTIVENVLKHGTGAIDIDGCRIPTNRDNEREFDKENASGKKFGFNNNGNVKFSNGQIRSDGWLEQGRFPANIICTDDALNDNQDVGYGKSGKPYSYKGKKYEVEGFIKDNSPQAPSNYADSGSKSRYFDVDCWAEKHGLLQFPKASKKDRGESNTHCCCKPVHLMAWLIRLISKEGDIVLDPFAGSGTTGVACKKLKRKYILIEREAEYCEIIKARLKETDEQLTLF